MNSKNAPRGRIFAALAGALTLGSALLATPVNAAVLTFDGDVCEPSGTCSDSSLISQSYGDVAGVLDVQYANLAGNPGIASLRFWGTDYNDLVRVAWTDGGDGGSRAEIFLKPLNGGVVTLNSFDLGAWPDTQRTTSFTILDGDGNLLASSGGDITIGIQPGNLHNHFDFGDVASNTGIRIQWGPSAFNVGIDNVDFSVSAVPLPAPAWLLGAGVVALAARRRRKV
ncbi:MAG: VPLPA-CTERM sorting domain-containing protein [Proteobacteria bacterium]|nr:VPLPA-CTERM sorting domain-containing protein [Pseudomonadota bacterium]MBK8957646.1 VPLPA-CTERM sorting domain-containing protein [Pseudomonadota bacterium]